MRHYRNTFIAILFAMILSPMGVWAQNGANSPYTRYGFGQLSDQNLGGNKAMGGVGIGLRDGSQINVSNPASYTAVDSLTFLFDAGISLQNANFNDGKTKLNAKNSSFDYLAMQFRLCNKAAMTFGFLPYSTVGYGFSSSETINQGVGGWEEEVVATTNYSGNGGLHQAFIGAAYKIRPYLSLGMNVSYLFGDFTHSVTASFSDANINSLARIYTAQISDIKLDFGAQYSFKLSSKEKVTLGATYSWGHDLNAIKSTITEQKMSGSTVINDSVRNVRKAFQLPHSFGAGVTYLYDNRLLIGADFSLQKFSDVRLWGEDDQLADRMKISLGAQFQPKLMGRSIFSVMKYRAGIYYSDPYVKVDGQDAAREYGVSVGFACPLMTKWGNQSSIISISGEWVKVDPRVNGLLTENYLRLSVGLTFNELWFQKWKVR